MAIRTWSVLCVNSSNTIKQHARRAHKSVAHSSPHEVGERHPSNHTKTWPLPLYQSHACAPVPEPLSLLPLPASICACQPAGPSATALPFCTSFAALAVGMIDVIGELQAVGELLEAAPVSSAGGNTIASGDSSDGTVVGDITASLRCIERRRDMRHDSRVGCRSNDGSDGGSKEDCIRTARGGMRI